MENLFSSIITVLVYFIFFFFGYMIGYSTAIRKISKILNKLAEEINSIALNVPKNSKLQVTDVIPHLMAELVDQNLLLFDDKKNFVCQGKSVEELAENLLKYKKINTACIVFNNDKFYIVDGKVLPK